MKTEIVKCSNCGNEATMQVIDKIKGKHFHSVVSCLHCGLVKEEERQFLSEASLAALNEEATKTALKK